jgi:exosortase A-associated hydrolase 2
MTETPFFFNSGQHSLFGVKHDPAANEKNCGWILCHAFAEEKLWAHRVFVNISRQLAKAGYPALRFDYRGYGDSEGKFENSTIADQLEDIRCAIAQINKDYPHITEVGLIGLRYGATLAALCADNNPQVQRLVLWDPLVDMDRYMQEVLRANLTTQMVMHGKIVTNREQLTAQILQGEYVNVDGYDLSKDLFQAASEINLLRQPIRFDGRCLVVQIGRAKQAPKKDLQQLTDNFANAEMCHVAEEPFWKEIKNYIPRSEGLSTALFNWLGEPDE